MKTFKYSEDKTEFAKSSIFIDIPSGISSKKDLFLFFSEKLSFPDYFGYNWDAFDECINDLSWLDAERIILWHNDIPLFDYKKECRTYLEILIESTSNRLEINFPPDQQRNIENILSID